MKKPESDQPWLKVKRKWLFSVYFKKTVTYLKDQYPDLSIQRQVYQSHQFWSNRKILSWLLLCHLWKVNKKLGKLKSLKIIFFAKGNSHYFYSSLKDIQNYNRKTKNSFLLINVNQWFNGSTMGIICLFFKLIQ